MSNPPVSPHCPFALLLGKDKPNICKFVTIVAYILTDDSSVEAITLPVQSSSAGSAVGAPPQSMVRGQRSESLRDIRSIKRIFATRLPVLMMSLPAVLSLKSHAGLSPLSSLSLTVIIIYSRCKARMRDYFSFHFHSLITGVRLLGEFSAVNDGRH